jgi:hypothetical protein
MGEASKVYMPESDRGYAAWVKQNQHGYLVNAPKSASSTKRMMWHRADCGHIQPGEGLHFVERDDLKACSLDPGALAVWACSRGKMMDYCDTCRDAWVPEQR